MVCDINIRKYINIFLIMCFIIFPSVFAQSTSTENLILEVNLDRDVIYPGDIIKGNISILNNNSASIDVYIDIYALGREGWFTWNKNPIHISPYSTAKTDMEITIPSLVKGGRYYFYVYVKNSITKEVLATIKKSLYILDRPLLDITKIGVKFPEIEANKTQTIYVHISNIGELDAEKYSVIIKVPKIGFYRKYEPISLNVGESDIIVADIHVDPQRKPGNYEIIVEIYDDRGKKINENRHTFKVKRTFNVKEYSNVKENAFYKYIEMKVINKGNTPVTYTYDVGTRGFIWIYNFKGMSPIKKNGRYVILCDLDVNEECTFGIQINYWILYVILLILLTLLVLLFVSFTSPKIIKEFYIKGHRYNIILKITNHKMKELKEVILRDHIKGIFNIDESSILPKPSKIHKTKTGYIIEWRIGTLKPGEVRIFRYEIIPKISVIGDLKLDNATLEGKDNKGKRYFASS